MDYYSGRQVRFGFGNYHVTPTVKRLMIANGIVWLLQMLIGKELYFWFGLVPNQVFSKFFIWQFFTYMFLHGGFLHILINMFMLWMFGCEVERNWGSREFFKYYVLCGVGAGFFHLLFNATSPIPVVGASGAIYGVLIAFVLLYPDRILIFFPFFIPLKAKYWAMIFAGISLLMGFLGGRDGIAHFAHLGGMLIGFVYIKFGWRIALSNLVYKKKSEIKFKKETKKRKRLFTLKKEVDRILDKINDVGYENISEKDKQILKEASEKLAEESNEFES